MPLATTGKSSPQSFNPAARAATRLRELIAERTSKRPLWQPLQLADGRLGFTTEDGRLVSPQQLAFESLADELFYGGAGGGGKTDLLCGLATTQHRNTIIFRRELKQFGGADGIIARIRNIVGERGEVLETKARNIDGIRHIEFGAMQFENDKNKYKGRPHDLYGFDELPEFTESQYRFVTAWLRTSVTGQRCRVVATGNPPTDPEGEWIIQYWAPWLDPSHPNPAKPGELRWFAPIGDGGADREVTGPDRVQNKAGDWIKPRSRTFIPASVEDNPYYMNTGYADVLDNLPEPLRSQMRYGNFQVRAEDHPWQILPTAWVKAAQERWTVTPPTGVPLTSVGCDPSRGGQDKFCTAARYGHWIDEIKKHRAADAPDGAAGAMLVARDIMDWMSRDSGKLVTSIEEIDKLLPVGVDIIGSAGSSVFDQLTGMGLNAIALQGAEGTVQRDNSNKLGFYNKRAEWHWKLREWLDPNSGMNIALPPDRELLVDLCAPRWTMTPRGIKVESKDDVKARIGRSPDVGEAVIYAFAEDSSTGTGFLTWASQLTGKDESDDKNTKPRDEATGPTSDNPWFDGEEELEDETPRRRFLH